jgi:hypothetical protein
MGRGCGDEAPAGYFTLNYYSPQKKFNQMSAYGRGYQISGAAKYFSEIHFKNDVPT